MNQLTVGQFKAKFSEVLTKVLQGESVAVTYGKNKKKVAAIIPYKNYINKKKFKLGLLEGIASFKIHKDYKITDGQFLKS